jgi:paraquat-inducible protein A
MSPARIAGRADIIMTVVADAPLQLERTISCRRCGREYLLPRRRTLFASCPHCGASVRPLMKTLRMRHNGLAAILALAAIVVLALGVVSPFLSMNKLGQTRVFSLVGGIVELFHTGNTLIALVLLVFSVIFPFAKLLALLIATSRLAPISTRARKRLHHIAAVTGKYSLLDLLVVAIVIVVVKFRGIAEARALYGTTIFCVAIFLSILSGFAVNLKDDEEASETEPNPPTNTKMTTTAAAGGELVL